MMIEASYFCGMLGSGRFKPGLDGSYFIDRSPKLFEVILEFIADGELSLCSLSDDKKELRRLVEEFGYYSLDVPGELKKFGPLKWEPDDDDHYYKREHLQ